MNNYNDNYQELYHHGILGQKWGVRRYQNYDGTYTQAGMKRYNKSKELYEKHAEEYKKAKKEGTATDQMKIRKLNAKKQMNKDYKHLKQDKLGDKGKLRYAKGQTITGNKTTANTLKTIGGAVGAGAIYAQQAGLIDKKTAYILGGSALAITAIGHGKSFVDHHKNKQLRAYYGHTSNY